VLTGGAGARALSCAFEDVFGVRDGLRGVSMAGRTDAWIVAQAVAAHGLVCDAETLRRFRERYLAHLSDEVGRPGPRKGVMPGVRPLLDALAARRDAFLALLTGNFEHGARVKLEYFDLWHYFRCGAFGDAALERNGLLPTALARVEACGGPSPRPSDVVVVGDTPLDVAVARAGGARSVAVATGSYDVLTLSASGADVVLEDFSDLRAALEAFGF
jgi:phosphoglycolate phosphatase-like HAD superfamily hydrolase